MIVVAHLMLLLGHIAGGIFGKTLTDLSGNDYPRYRVTPVSVLKAESGTLKTLERSIRQTGRTLRPISRQALDIWTDAELVEDIRQRTEAEIIFWESHFTRSEIASTDSSVVFDSLRL